jgi:hypothetical protein
MKKICTMMMLSIMAVMGAEAEETTLWEGDWYVTWNGTGGHNEWGAYNEVPTLNQDITPYMVTGATINIYLKINDMQDDSGSVYHKAQFDNWDWESLPGLSPVEFSADKVVTIDVTDELAAALNKGFRIHGHGFNVVKVTLGDNQSAIDDLDAAVLWAGEQVIDGWGANAMVINNENNAFPTFVEKLTKACNLYFLMDNTNSGDFRIAGGWGDWGNTSYPSDGYNHMKADADNVVKVALTEDFVQKAFVEQGGIAFWGNGGFTIKRIATTREAAITGTTTGINSIAVNEQQKDNRYYNLNGQVVAKPTRGLYIHNGKKFVIK